jgi:diaminohydroxyphosphoribosylaminopyrimidine deaminase / 5-amino-6-(5-phosphoribosylamino)uracil reductase
VNFTERDARFMARALRLAERGLYTTDPNPRVGCVIVKEGDVIAEGWHERAGEGHAEVQALAVAGDKARGADVYVTLEPCSHVGRTPPCVEALIRAGVRRVVAAMRDPNPLVDGKGLDRLTAAGIEASVGLLETQAEALNVGFISRMRRRKPYVRVKIGASLDGRTALASGESRWITGTAARLDVQRWRARSSAILTGTNTILTDDPELTVREFDIGRQPLRIVVDANLRTPPSAKILKVSGSALIVTTNRASAEARAALRAAGAEVIVSPERAGKVDVVPLMRTLAERSINEVLVEAGSRLCGSLLSARLIDEFVFYFAPSLLGSGARGIFNLPDIVKLSDRVPLEFTDVRAVGDDIRICARPARG